MSAGKFRLAACCAALCLAAPPALAERFDLVCDVYRDISQGREGYQHLALRLSVDTDKAEYVEFADGQPVEGVQEIAEVTDAELVLKRQDQAGAFVYDVVDRKAPSYVHFEVVNARTVLSESGNCTKRSFTGFPGLSQR